MKNKSKSRPKTPSGHQLTLGKQMRNALTNEAPIHPLTVFYEYLADIAIEDEIKRFADLEFISDPVQAENGRTSKKQLPPLSEAEALRLIATNETFLSVAVMTFKQRLRLKRALSSMPLLVKISARLRLFGD